MGNWLLYPLEQRFPPWDAARGAPYGIIVLGGSIDADLSAAHNGAVVRSGADRIIAAAVLARRYPDAHVIFSGGSGNLVSNDAREADYAGPLFENLGVDKARLTMERRSRNTQENAEFSKALAATASGERWLLVTSAYHMPRSIGLFRKAGFAVEAYPVDWRIGIRADLLGILSDGRRGARIHRYRPARMDRAFSLLADRQDRRAPPGTGDEPRHQARKLGQERISGDALRRRVRMLQCRKRSR